MVPPAPARGAPVVTGSARHGIRLYIHTVYTRYARASRVRTRAARTCSPVSYPHLLRR